MAQVLTDVGKAIIANRLLGSGTEPKHAAWGTGAGTAAAGDTTLFTEASEARVSGTSSRVTTDVTNDTYQVDATIVADGTKTITNAGLFDAATAGNLFAKASFSGLGLEAGESLRLIWQVQFE